MNKTISALFFCSSLWISLTAQKSLTVSIVMDTSETQVRFLETEIQTEINAILSAEYDILYKNFYASRDLGNSSEIIARSYQDQETDIVIGVGFDMCSQFALLEAYPKPTILTVIVDNELQNIPLSNNGSSGVANLTYVQSPFEIRGLFEVLYEIRPYKKILLVGTRLLDAERLNLESFYRRIFPKPDLKFQTIQAIGTASSVLDSIEEDVDAAFIYPISDVLPIEELQKMVDGFNQRKIPTISLFSSPLIEMGVYASFESIDNINRIPRRVALDVMKIVQGEDPSELQVGMENFTRTLLINMQTARAIGIYPSFDILAEAILINVTSPDPKSREISLRSSIAEGLEKNLTLRVTQKETEISEKNVAFARGAYLPQANASASVSLLDDNSVRGSFGTRGNLSLNTGISLTQLILSEPALANIAIQKLLLESQREALRQNELDIVIDVSNAYLDILQSLELVKLRNQNVRVTRKNYDIARNKEQVGYGATNDVYRWESELALDNIDLNNTQATFRQTQYNLNRILNRTIKEDFLMADVSLSDSILALIDNELFEFIDSPGKLGTYADFMVDEAFRNLPELGQIEAAIAAEQRNLTSQNRAFYLPSLALSAEAAFPIDNYGFPNDVMKMNPLNTYNAGVALQLPIFQGNQRRVQQQQTQISLLQLDDQKQDLKNQLEFLIRSNLEVAGASFGNLELSLIAEEAAAKNFDIAQNSYQQGLLNVTSLIDAQNAFLQAQINATNAEYTFIKDYLAVERSNGFFNFLATADERLAYRQRFIQFVNQ